MPYAISSLLLNLFRGDYDFFYIIPGVGGVLASSSKIIHRIIRYIINSKKIENVENYYKQILALHEFIRMKIMKNWKIHLLDHLKIILMK